MVFIYPLFYIQEEKLCQAVNAIQTMGDYVVFEDEMPLSYRDQMTEAWLRNDVCSLYILWKISKLTKKEHYKYLGGFSLQVDGRSWFYRIMPRNINEEINRALFLVEATILEESL